MPLILGALAVLGVGGLVFKDIFDETQETLPPLIVLGALGVAGFAVWAMAKKKG